MKVFFFVSLMFGSILRTVVSDYFVNIDLLQFSNGDGCLIDGTHCDSFWFAGRQCNIRLKICIENINTATTGEDTCSTAFIDLGQVTTNQNSITFATNTWYGAWLNPSPFRFVDNAFEGIQVKLIAQHTGVNDYPLIDQFVWPIRNNSQTGVASFNHSRPNAPDPTSFQLAWTVGGNVSPPAGTTTTPMSPTVAPPPRDCSDIFADGVHYLDGEYVIYLPNGNNVTVFCDLAQGGWTVIQNRADTTDFNLTYAEYENFFGTPITSYWLGLKNINSLVTSGKYALKIDLCCGIHSSSVSYDYFSIGDSSASYALNVSLGNGTAGDGFNDNLFGFTDNGAKFSTNDNFHQNGPITPALCKAFAGYGGWWLGSCNNNLNGKLYPSDSDYTTPATRVLNSPTPAGIIWGAPQTFISHKKARMKIVPFNRKPTVLAKELELLQLAAYCS